MITGISADADGLGNALRFPSYGESVVTITGRNFGWVDDEHESGKRNEVTAVYSNSHFDGWNSFDAAHCNVTVEHTEMQCAQFQGSVGHNMQWAVGVGLQVRADAQEGAIHPSTPAGVGTPVSKGGVEGE